jgi:DinB family protein
MIPQIAWRDRKFALDLPIGTFPLLIERLRGTPVRAKELVAGFPEHTLAIRVKDKWSVKEHLGHLADLEHLDSCRLSEFLKHAKVLSAADTKNRATELADHRSVSIQETILKLSAGREALVHRLEDLQVDQVTILTIHPRLQTPMRLLDWVYFVAEHDDHHLARARRVITTLQS